MERTLRALSALLTYPSPALKEAAWEIGEAVYVTGTLTRDVLLRLGSLIAEIEGEPLLALRERYVALFDRSRSLSLDYLE